MKTKILANNIGAVKVLVLALACSVSVAKAAVITGENLTWYQTNPFAGGTAWGVTSNAGFVSANNPAGAALGSILNTSVNTSLYASFATQTLSSPGDSVRFVLQAKRSVIPTTANFLTVGLGNDGGTPFTQNYFNPDVPPTAGDFVSNTFFNNLTFFDDTDVHTVEILISRWTPAPTFFRRQVYLDNVEIPQTGDGFFAVTDNPSAQFNQVSINWDWSGNEGPNLISVIPEPSTVAFVASGLVGLMLLRTRRKSA